MDILASYQFEYIRRSGVVNVLDLREVAELANSAGFDELYEACGDVSLYIIVVVQAHEQLNEDDYLQWLIDEGYVTDVDEYLDDMSRPGTFASELYEIIQPQPPE